MNVEDSYEGAVRRLRRLENAGFHAGALAEVSADRAGDADRMRDLEELATLACDDNERLTRELDEARGQIERLRLQVMMLQQQVAGAPADEPLALPRRSRAGMYFFLLAIAGAAAAALFVLRPWERPHVAIDTASPYAPATTPSVTPPPAAATPPAATPSSATPPAATPSSVTPPATIPKVAATIPKAAATIPTVTATVPKLAAASPRSHHHHAARHHKSAHKHHAAARSNDKTHVGDTDDPLGGVNL